MASCWAFFFGTPFVSLFFHSLFCCELSPSWIFSLPVLNPLHPAHQFVSCLPLCYRGRVAFPRVSGVPLVPIVVVLSRYLGRNRSFWPRPSPPLPHFLPPSCSLFMLPCVDASRFPDRQFLTKPLWRKAKTPFFLSFSSVNLTSKYGDSA